MFDSSDGGQAFSNQLIIQSVMRSARDVARENSEWETYLPALAQALYSALGVEIDEYQLYLDMDMEALRESIMEVHTTIPEEYETSLDLLRAAADVFTSLRYQMIGQPMMRIQTGLRARDPKDEVPLVLAYIKHGLHPSELYKQVTGTLEFFEQMTVPADTPSNLRWKDLLQLWKEVVHVPELVELEQMD